jgi:hypothetical protein
MSATGLTLPESNSSGAGSGGSGVGPPTTGGPQIPSEGLRGLLLRWLARRYANVTGFVGTETALENANARRRLVDEALRDVAGHEVLEIPDRLKLPRQDPVDLTGPEVAARQVAFEWQRSSPGLLLLARVCDTIDALSRTRQQRYDAVREGHPAVVLMPVPRLVRRLAPLAFPWRVVVLATPHPEPMADMLSQFREWFGVGVHVERGRDIKRLRGCAHVDGRDGTVGGVVVMGRDDDAAHEPYGLTCGHVVSEQCPSVRIRSLPVRHGWAPDAALVRLDGSCLPAPPAHRDVTPVSFNELEDLSLDHVAVSLHTAQGSQRKGYLKGHMLFASDREGPLRFPSVFLSRERATYAGIPWPPFGRALSKSGDSGAWVTLAGRPERWLAMVVSGDGKGETIGHAAGPLLRWLQLVASDGGVPGPAETEWFRPDVNGVAAAIRALG